MTGVRKRSARLKASTVSEKHSATELGHQGDDGVLAVGAPARLHDVALAGLGGQPGGGAAAHDVDNDAGDLRHGGVADVLLHEREAGPRGRRERLGAGQRGADDGGDGGDLVLHLDEVAAHRGQAAGEDLGDLGRGRDGVAGEEARAGGDGPLGDRLVALHQSARRAHQPCAAAPVVTRRRSSLHEIEMAKSGQWYSQRRQTVQSERRATTG